MTETTRWTKSCWDFGPEREDRKTGPGFLVAAAAVAAADVRSSCRRG